MADEIQVNLTSTTVQAGGVYSGDTVIGAASMVDSKRLVSALAVGAVQESALLDAIAGGYVLTIGGTLTGARTITAPDASLTLAGQDYANVFTVGQQFPVGSSSALGIVFGALANASNRTGFYGDLTASAENIAMVVGGQTGPIYTRSGTDVNAAISGALSVTKQITSTLATGTAPFIVASTTNVANLNASSLNGATFASPGAIGSTTAGTGKFTSITNTSLTNGRVPFASTGGLMTDSAGLTYASGALTVGDGTTAQTTALFINGIAGQNRTIRIQTGGLDRWRISGTSGAETGSNAGTPLSIQAFDDTGTLIDAPIGITRASGGAINFTRPLQPSSGSASAPSYAFSTDTTTGFYRQASGVVGIASAGTGHTFISNLQHLFSHNASVAIGTSPIQSQGSGYVTFYLPDATAGGYIACAFGASAGFISKRANGTAGSLSALSANDQIANNNIIGYEGTTPGFTGLRSTWNVLAAESWTSTAQGFYHDFFTNATGTTNPTVKMRLQASGNLTIGTTTDGMTAGGSFAVAKDFAHRGTKAGLFNATPVTQPSTTGTATGFTAGAGTAVTDQSTFTGGTGTTAYRISDIVLALKQIGAMAA